MNIAHDQNSLLRQFKPHYKKMQDDKEATWIVRAML